MSVMELEIYRGKTTQVVSWDGYIRELTERMA